MTKMTVRWIPWKFRRLTDRDDSTVIVIVIIDIAWVRQYDSESNHSMQWIKGEKGHQKNAK